MSNNSIYDNLITLLEADTKKISLKTTVTQFSLLDSDQPEGGIDESGNGLVFDELTILTILKSLSTDQYRVLFLIELLNQLGYEFNKIQIGSVWKITNAAICQKIDKIAGELNKENIKDIL